MTAPRPIPTLPQSMSNDKEAIAQRKFDVQLARANYNYMFSYLEPVPMSAGVPRGEEFTPEYLATVSPVFRALVDNFVKVVVGLVEKEIRGDVSSLSLTSIHEVNVALKRLEQNDGIVNPLGELVGIIDLVKALAAVPSQLDEALTKVTLIAKDLDRIGVGLETQFQQIEQEGLTAFLKYTLYNVMNPSKGRDYLQARSTQDYIDLFCTLPQPLVLTLPKEPWMELSTDQQPWQADWYFGYEQIAGYNTTLLQGVTTGGPAHDGGIPLDALRRKFPIDDALFQSVVGDSALTLESAAHAGQLFVCDYTMLEGIPGGEVFGLSGKMRYPVAPIALFYWNRNAPRGYPPQPDGVMQPIAIQLGQKWHPEETPIFTPHDGDTWTVAKTFVQNASAIQHETVAHLGACHLTIEPMIVATHRQLPPAHPIYVLLAPHFRFTIAVNDDALKSLIAPGGVVATNIGTSIEGSMKLVQEAYKAWRFDEQEPRRLFRSRAVGGDELPDFPFRDDTLLVWDALFNFVGKYLKLYYSSDADVKADFELQAWIGEMVSQEYASVCGMDGLVNVGTTKMPIYRIHSLSYLTQVITQIIYIAGPQHASVNYAQYPLMSLVCSSPGGMYQPPPTRSSKVVDPIAWLPPLDVALYQVSFVYLLAMVQYDTLGVYSTNPRTPYFADPRVDDLVADLQGALAVAEITIRKRNRSRPIPYLFQLPSMIPNSISI
jgi:arachidonate 15-lipoxygenase